MVQTGWQKWTSKQQGIIYYYNDMFGASTRGSAHREFQADVPGLSQLLQTGFCLDAANQPH